MRRAVYCEGGCKNPKDFCPEFLKTPARFLCQKSGSKTQTGNFDCRAPVHYHTNPPRLCPLCGAMIFDPQLHPDRFQPRKSRKGLIHHRADFFGPAENVDHIDLGFNIAQGSMDSFPKCGFAGLARIDWNHTIAPRREIGRDPVAGPVWFWRPADKGDGFCLGKN